MSDSNIFFFSFKLCGLRAIIYLILKEIYFFFFFCSGNRATLSKNQDLNFVTPIEPRLTFDHINEMEGLKLMHMY